MINTRSYRTPKYSSNKRGSIVILLILLIVGNPIISIATDFSKERMELSENNTEEKKELTDNEEFKIHEYYSMYLDDSESFPTDMVENYYVQKQFADFNPKILIPPPQKG